MERRMDNNLFDPEHLFYGLAGAAVVGLLGYFIGLAIFAASAAAASYNTNVTAANFFITRFSSLPMIGTIIGTAIGLFGGIIYSRERRNNIQGQLPVVVLPQPSGAQAPVILVPQQPQTPQVPQIVVLPQGGQQPIVLTPQQAQQQK
jgi:hypothetical protein